MRPRFAIRLVSTPALALFLLSGCGAEAFVGGSEAGTPTYEATVRWTSYGIPHVEADDWGGLGYGLAHAVAEDAICVLAREVVTVNGELSRWFGSENGNLRSDLFHRSVMDDETLRHFAGGQRPELVSLSAGYVAGYNDWLAENRDELPASCAGAEWVRPITDEDLTRIAVGVGIRYGVGQMSGLIAAAAPPEEGAPAPSEAASPDAAASNALAFGSAATENGRGLLLGNPHYPWRGPSRFHIRHLTIPGEVDVMGAGLYTTNVVAIGFNSDVAWSHTVSTALRHTVYRLDLVEGDPRRYRYGDEVRALEPREVTVPVRDEGGEIREERHTVWFGHHGPVLEVEGLPWTEEHAFVVRDANIRNDRSLEQYYRLDRAGSVDEVLEALREVQGIAWVNTVAADRHGDALYADLSVVPNVDEALLERCRVPVEAPPSLAPVGVLDGSDPSCEWREDPDAAEEGIMPPDRLPWIVRDDYVTNSNDSYWLANPEEPLEGYSPLIGGERTPRSLRTRAGLAFVGEVLEAGERMTPAKVREILFSHRNHAAEMLLDDVLAICDEEPARVVVDGEATDAGEACAVLARWDRAHTVESRGAHVWTEFWRTARALDDLWAVPFDPERPVETPRGIRHDDPRVREAVMRSLAAASDRLRAADVPLDAPLGDVQFVVREGEKIPIPGGPGWDGAFSMTVAELTPGQGYTPVRHGNSYIQVVTWDERGDPDVWALLTYSQSQEPESPHHADQTRLYSRGEWVELPFTDSEIAADPNLRTVELRGTGATAREETE